MNLQEMIISKVCDKDFKVELVNRLNSNINIPFISEKTEGKILSALVDEVEQIITEKIRTI